VIDSFNNWQRGLYKRFKNGLAGGSRGDASKLNLAILRFPLIFKATNTKQGESTALD